MAEEFGNQLKNKITVLFENCVDPLLHELISEYNGINGIKAKIITESPVMMGIEKCNSIVFEFPNGVEHLICIYWIGGEERIILENLRMVTLNRSLNIYNLDKNVLKKTIKMLAGLGNLK